MRGKRHFRLVSIATVGVVIVTSLQVEAARFTSPNYTIDASVANNFGGQDSSGNYKLVASGGESIVGNGASGSYKMGMGYTAQLVTALQLSIDKTQVDFSDLVAGTPQTSVVTMTAQTDAAGYSLALAQNNDLSDGAGHTIPAVTGTIGAPAVWTDGTTKGLGFTLTSAVGGVPAKWNSSNSYARFPTASTVFFTRSGKFSGSETTGLRFKIDTDSAQTPGTYTNIVTTTGTVTP